MKRFNERPRYWQLWYYLTKVYFGFWRNDKMWILSTPLFSISRHRGAHAANMDAMEWGWRIYFWPTFPQEGGYLYKYKHERISRVAHSYIAARAARAIKEIGNAQ